MEPLFDLYGRTLCVGQGNPAACLDALLRMNSDTKRWRTPITAYLGVGAEPARALRASEALALCGVIASLRSPLHTIGMGLLTGFQALVLAAGRPGHRHLLRHALVSVGTLDLEELPLPNGELGLTAQRNGPSLRAQAQALLRVEIAQLSRRLGLSAGLWQAPRILSAQETIQAGLADSLVPALLPPIAFTRQAASPFTPTHEHTQF
jgi:hypothetical protein